MFEYPTSPKGKFTLAVVQSRSVFAPSIEGFTMSLDSAVRERIETLLTQNPVVLFMKGVPGAPQCGFSAKASGILDSLGVAYAGVNVLADPEIRDGIKAYGNWPTIPQLYVNGELVGGSDIISGLVDSGEIFGLLGVSEPDRTPPEIRITETAAEKIRGAMADADDLVLHLAVGPRFESRFELAPAETSDIVAEAQGIRVHFDLASAQRARGIRIDWVEDVRGAGLSIHNPNAPPAVKSISVRELRDRLAADNITVIDVRPVAARGIAPFPPAHEVLDQETAARIKALPKDQAIAFLCHHGSSSLQHAEHFRDLGFTEIYNVEGGIDAWSVHVDPTVARY